MEIESMWSTIAVIGIFASNRSNEIVTRVGVSRFRFLMGLFQPTKRYNPRLYSSGARAYSPAVITRSRLSYMAIRSSGRVSPSCSITVKSSLPADRTWIVVSWRSRGSPVRDEGSTTRFTKAPGGHPPSGGSSRIEVLVTSTGQEMSAEKA